MPAPLRLSLVHQTVLLLVAAVLLAVSALGGVVAWNLRSGFSDYLRLQDKAWLERFARIAAQAVARDGLEAVLAGPPGSLNELFLASGPPDQRPPGLDEPPPRRADGPPPQGGEPPPRRMPPGAQRFAGRLSIVSVDGRTLSGHPPPPDVDGVLDQPIVLAGQVVAIARIEPGPQAPQSVDAAFLARQYRGILLSGLVLVGLAVAAAAWVGRRWLRPVQEARQAAHRIAEGAFDTRLVPRGNDELAGLAQDINAMAGSLQQLEASRRRWIAELSHEMRTPLAVLRGEVECLIDGLRPLDGAALLSLHAEVARLTRLVEDFHHLALSDLRALPCSFAPLEAGELVQQAVARFTPRAGAAGLSLACEVPPASLHARWDHQRICQLLDNLLENSVRYTNAPGSIQLVLRASGNEARLTLDDSAPGVELVSQARLFEPLFRADASRSRQSGGSGLGLAIAQAIVRSHGGRISAVASSLGGLRIEVNLPVVPEGA
jgi:two-component system sensor histidine kinase BaeS